MADERILVEGGLVYDHDGDCDRPAALDILIEGARIARVEPGLRAALAARRRPTGRSTRAAGSSSPASSTRITTRTTFC